MSPDPVRIDLFRVRCLIPQARMVGSALRVRRRLARVARVHLSAPLERALGGGGEERWVLDKVDVRLELVRADDRDHDDVTLAARWAARIAAAMRDAMREGKTRFRRFPTPRSYAEGLLEEILSAGGKEAWLPRAVLGAEVRASPLGIVEHLVEELGPSSLRKTLKEDRPLALRLFRSLSRVERALAVTAVNPRTSAGGDSSAGRSSSPDPLRSRRGLRARRPDPPEGPASRRVGAPPAEGHAEAAAPEPDDPSSTSLGFEAWLRAMTTEGASAFRSLPPEPQPGIRAERGTSEPPSAGLEAHEPFEPVPPDPPLEEEPPGIRHGPTAPRPEEPEEVDSRRDSGPIEGEGNGFQWFTLASGIVFLHPWLRRYLEEGVSELGAVEPVRIPFRRCLLLASLLGEPGPLASDPLIRLLAGDDPNRPWTPPEERESALPLALDRAEGVLDRFAGAFPGTRSQLSHGMIREHILQRTGTVHPLYRQGLEDEDPTLVVRPDPGPLDALVHALPYPVTLFKLPWTPPIQVLFGGRHA